MPNYKTNKKITESFIEKLFTSIGKGLRSAAIKDLSKRDPKLAKDIESIEDLRADIQRRLAKLK
tara:strand:- start:144 stop:335 length:192 start_codon:yes stop_codon:yes gene_type:complete